MRLRTSYHHIWMLTVTVACLFSSCSNPKQQFIDDIINRSAQQLHYQLELIGLPDGKNYPRTLDSEGKIRTTSMYDWTPGFFPGSLWYMYELSGDQYWKENASRWTETLEPLQTFTGHHDLGFMIFCSYGNGQRLCPNDDYRAIIIRSAQSLSTRFSETTSTIKSWNYRKAWNGKQEWFYPVIIDNMMNLEMLFYASDETCNNYYKNIAIRHSDATIKNHFREDFSTFHVVDYDTITGKVLHQATCQGYSDNSTWARGQAWAIYGFTMAYRFTHDERYLDAAEKATEWYVSHLPDDLVPYWDFNAGDYGYDPGELSNAKGYGKQFRDASAAAIVCSALFELDTFSPKKVYGQLAVKMLKSLASDEYFAKTGTNAGFLLKHSVGSIPHNTEIDVPLVYADYYFLEALKRYKESDL